MNPKSTTEDQSNNQWFQYRWFRKGIAYKGGWELNVWMGAINIRIAKYQFAFWYNYNTVFNLTF